MMQNACKSAAKVHLMGQKGIQAQAFNQSGNQYNASIYSGYLPGMQITVDERMDKQQPKTPHSRKYSATKLPCKANPIYKRLQSTNQQ